MANPQEQLFTETEVIDLCNSIINIHRVLITLAQFINDLESTENGFIFIGLRSLAERFLVHQNTKLTRIMEIYKAETDRLIQRTRTEEKNQW